MLKNESDRLNARSFRNIKIAGIVASAILLFFMAILSTFIGPVRIQATDVIVIYLKQIPVLGHFLSFTVSGKDYGIIVFLREPEVIGGILVGASLGIGGAVIQSLFRNPITEPYIIGLSSGASLGAVASIMFGLTLFGIFTVPLMAFIFSIAVVGIVYMFALRGGKVSPTYLLLTGIAISLFVSSLVALMLFTNVKLQGAAFFWLLGSLSGITWTELLPVSAIVISTSLIISLYHRELDALQLGEFHARSVGVSVENVKRVMIVLVTLSVSAAVSVSGIIGFVGLIMPHISRLLYGGSNRFVIPSSAIMGAIFLLAADDISRVVITGEVVPIGVVTGMIGVPVFMYLLRRLSGGVYEH